MLPNEAVQPAIHLAVELSSSAWLVAVQSPAAAKVRLHRMNAGDVKALLSLIALLRSRAASKLGIDVPVASCFEAGRDGFWFV